MKVIFSQVSSGRVDRSAGVIRGVSVITCGEARGHGMSIDAVTLSQVHAAAGAFPGGIRVSENHGSGFESIVGRLSQFRIEGSQLRADLHLIKSHQGFARILDLAELQPQTFGLSIAFSGKHEVIAGTTFARCLELYSVDLVPMPAANPGGLFSANFAAAGTELEKLVARAIQLFGRKVLECLLAGQSTASGCQEILQRELRSGPSASMSRQTFQKLPQKDRSTWCKLGGKITD